MERHGEDNIGPHDHGEKEANLCLELHFREEVPCEDRKNDGHPRIDNRLTAGTD